LLVGFFFFGSGPMALGSGQEDEADDELVMEFIRYYKPKRSIKDKIEAIYVLKGADSVAAVEALTKAFSDKEIRVRRAVIDTVGTYRNPEVIQYLLDHFILNRKERKEDRLSCAVEALGLIGDPGVAEHLLEFYDRIKSWELKKTVAVALGRVKSEKGLPTLGKPKHQIRILIHPSSSLSLLNRFRSTAFPPAKGIGTRPCFDPVSLKLP